MQYVGRMEATSLLRAAPGGAILDVWVVPGASRTEIKGVYDGALRVRVASPPTGGEANRALMRYLGERLDCKVRLVAGASSRRKAVHIGCVDLAWITASLGLECQ